MKNRIRTLIWLSLLGCVVNLDATQKAWASDLSKFLREVFGQHQNRPLTGAELNYYANYYRQAGMQDALIQLFASDSYFAGACQSNYDVYVTQIYRYFVGRDPRPDERRYWVNQFYARGHFGRAPIIQEICRASNVVQQPSWPSNLPSFPTSGSITDIAADLVNRTNAFVVQASAELGNSIYGRNVVADAQTLLAITKQFRQVCMASNASPQQMAIALDNVERQVQEVAAELRSVPGASYQLSTSIQQVAQVASSARRYTGTTGSQPTYPGQLPGLDGNFAILINIARNWTQTVVAMSHYNPYYVSLARDAQGLVVQIEAVDALVRNTNSRRDVEFAMYQVNQLAGRIGGNIGQADSQLQRGWWQVKQSIDNLNASLGIHAEQYSTLGQATIVNRPIWGDAPFQNASYSASIQSNAALVSAADELVSQLDQYTVNLQPIGFQNPLVGGLTSSVGDLRNAALRFRQVAATGGYGTQLSTSANQLMQQYRTTANSFAAVVAQNPSMNSPVFMQVGESIEKIRRATL